jgi:hypothetical protein
MIYKSKLIDQVAGDTTKKLREQADLQEKNGSLKKAEEIRSRAAAIEQGILEGKDLEQAQKSVDTQAKFNLALERAKEIFTDVVDGGLLDGLVSALGDIVVYLERLGYGDRGARLAKETEQMSQKAKEKKIEFDVDEYQQIQEDAQEGFFTAFISSINPLSFLNKSTKAQKRLEEINQKINVDDFTIRTHPKDELVIAGGTNLSGGSNQEMIGLLQKLVSATEQSRQVTVAVDGEAIFSAMGKTPMK